MDDQKRYRTLKQFLDAVDATIGSIDWGPQDRLWAFRRDGVPLVFETKILANGEEVEMAVSPERQWLVAWEMRNELMAECQAVTRRFREAQDSALDLITSDLVACLGDLARDPHALATSLEQAIQMCSATFAWQGDVNADTERSGLVRALAERLVPIRAWCNRFERSPDEPLALQVEGLFSPKIPKLLAIALVCDDATLRKYAVAAGVLARGRGKRGAYTGAEVGRIVHHASIHGTPNTRDVATKMIATEMRKKSEMSPANVK